MWRFILLFGALLLIACQSSTAYYYDADVNQGEAYVIIKSVSESAVTEELQPWLDQSGISPQYTWIEAELYDRNALLADYFGWVDPPPDYWYIVHCKFTANNSRVRLNKLMKDGEK